MHSLLIIFVIFKVFNHLLQTSIAFLNRKYYRNAQIQAEGKSTLDMTPENFEKTLDYTEAKFHFGLLSGFIQLGIVLAFILLGGFRCVEDFSLSLFAQGTLSQGVAFLLSLILLSMIMSLPFGYYSTFVIEEKFGFNKQTPQSFFLDQVKGVVLTFLLGGLLFYTLLYVMQLGPLWWIAGWATMTFFTLFTSFIYPTLLAPLFNKFEPLQDGELKEKIFQLAQQTDFDTDGIFIMDASSRSTHGNAYFTGLFGKKRIVLFDTLVQKLTSSEIVAVLAHELGHFKLNHVRNGLIRSSLISLGLFYLMSLILPHFEFYEAFGLSAISSAGGLLVFFLWFSLIDFYLSPLSSMLSRRNEFAADAFAIKKIGTPIELKTALLKLRAANFSMPLAHPLYSAIYHSHPPLIERIAAFTKTN